MILLLDFVYFIKLIQFHFIFFFWKNLNYDVLKKPKTSKNHLNISVKQTKLHFN